MCLGRLQMMVHMLGPSHSHGTPQWISWLLTVAWPTPDCWGHLRSKLVEWRSVSLSLPFCFISSPSLSDALPFRQILTNKWGRALWESFRSLGLCCWKGWRQFSWEPELLPTTVCGVRVSLDSGSFPDTRVMVWSLLPTYTDVGIVPPARRSSGACYSWTSRTWAELTSVSYKLFCLGHSTIGTEINECTPQYIYFQ